MPGAADRQTFASLAGEAAAILRAGTRAADAYGLVHGAVRREGARVWFHPKEAYDLTAFARVIVLGAGKAAAPMARALEEILGDRLTGGVVAVQTGTGAKASLARVEVVEGDHPIPGPASVEAAAAVGAMASHASASDLVVAVISGGASSIIASPEDGLTLGDLQTTWAALLASGEDITAMNGVRKHAARLLGGKLARAASPATLVTLVLSDVPDNRLDSVGSGPSVADPSTFAEALVVLGRVGAVRAVGENVAAFFEEGAQGKRPETPKPHGPPFERSYARLVGSNADAVAGAMRAAAERGYADGGDFRKGRSSEVSGSDARSVGRALATFALYHLELIARGIRESKPVAIVGGGEAPMRLGRKPGRGGRLSELALAAAEVIQGTPGVVVGAMATDGLDGAWDASLVVADGGTLERANAAGLDWAAERDANNTAAVFEAAGTFEKRALTLTNVADLYVALVSP
jgi:glycerate 2-kinase